MHPRANHPSVLLRLLFLYFLYLCIFSLLCGQFLLGGVTACNNRTGLQFFQFNFHVCNAWWTKRYALVAGARARILRIISTSRFFSIENQREAMLCGRRCGTMENQRNTRTNENNIKKKKTHKHDIKTIHGQQQQIWLDASCKVISLRRCFQHIFKKIILYGGEHAQRTAQVIFQVHPMLPTLHSTQTIAIHTTHYTHTHTLSHNRTTCGCNAANVHGAIISIDTYTLTTCTIFCTWNIFAYTRCNCTQICYDDKGKKTYQINMILNYKCVLQQHRHRHQRRQPTATKRAHLNAEQEVVVVVGCVVEWKSDMTAALSSPWRCAEITAVWSHNALQRHNLYCFIVVLPSIEYASNKSKWLAADTSVDGDWWCAPSLGSARDITTSASYTLGRRQCWVVATYAKYITNNNYMPWME